jgi:hypothetical protein
LFQRASKWVFVVVIFVFCVLFCLQASDIQARTVVLTWSSPSSFVNGETDETTVPELYGYEILVSSTGKDGKYRSVYV